jgi:hypothetical protein
MLHEIQTNTRPVGEGGWRKKSVAKILAIVVSASRMHDEMPLFKVTGPAPKIKKHNTVVSSSI